jgi:hypothetical protein
MAVRSRKVTGIIKIPLLICSKNVKAKAEKGMTVWNEINKDKYVLREYQTSFKQ